MEFAHDALFCVLKKWDIHSFYEVRQWRWSKPAMMLREQSDRIGKRKMRERFEKFLRSKFTEQCGTGSQVERNW